MSGIAPSLGDSQHCDTRCCAAAIRAGKQKVLRTAYLLLSKDTHFATMPASVEQEDLLAFQLSVRYERGSSVFLLLAITVSVMTFSAQDPGVWPPTFCFRNAQWFRARLRDDSCSAIPS